LKIVNIRSVIVHAEMRNRIFVRVETDQDGLFGWGEATLEWKTRSVAGAIDDLAPLVIGRDPRDIEKLVRIMKKHSFWRLGVIGMSAVSGIEIALWDILGKSLSVPVWMLLGGRVRDRVRVYTHLGLGDMRAVYETESAKQLVERAHQVLARGYRAMKVVTIPYTHYTSLLPQVDRTARMMGVARRGRVGHRDHGRLPWTARLRWRGARLYRRDRARAADVRRGGVAAWRFSRTSRSRLQNQRSNRHRRAPD
jgi:galactonate dehydratase